ncbi:MAG: response regulator transcription factor [Oscillospiraceae bacterium]|nr:response regulator transcription factor [Oscillospiraceae bacterium]
MVEVLLIESNEALCAAISAQLRAEGFTAVAVRSGTDALKLLNAPRFESVLLEWMLPDMDGVSVLREMRTRSLDTPVMVLSSRGCVADRVLALDSGADDYLLKPFHMEECMARLRRMVRTYRRSEISAAGLHCVADLTVDTARHIATRGGRRLLLSAKECAILEVFAAHAGQTVSQQELEEAVMERGAAPGIIPVYIHYLRKKLDDGYRLKLLRTVRNQGYVLSAS